MRLLKLQPRGGWVWHEGIPVISKHWNGNNNTIAQVDRGSLAWHEDANSASRESGANARHIATANPTTVIALLDRLEAAEKDTARMNWLEQNLFNRENIDPFTKKPCTKFNMWAMFSPKGVQGSARGIIDAAMKEQK